MNQTAAESNCFVAESNRIGAELNEITAKSNSFRAESNRICAESNSIGSESNHRFSSDHFCIDSYTTYSIEMCIVSSERMNFHTRILNRQYLVFVAATQFGIFAF